MDDTTHPPLTFTDSTAGPDAAEAHALVLLWSRDEPERAGEVLLIPSLPDAAITFGREGARGSRPGGAVGLARQRPGALESTGQLACPRISRTQLRLSALPTGALAVENVGRCPLVHRGKDVSRAELSPGDVIELRHEIVFLCARRPRALPPLLAEGGVDVHPFGEPDTFGLVGETPAIWSLRAAIAALARRPEHVLVLGSSGSGKELVARAIHAQSPRKRGPLVARNAATIPEGLVDAELFGHAKSFPNAGTPERAGLIGEANGGTLFLDELAELPLRLQAHLLRVMDEGEYHRLGEARARRADVRLVAATNRPDGSLKHDVLARFKARLALPALDARREDIPLLVNHLLRRHAASDPALRERFFREGGANPAPRTTPELITALVQHAYRTHVRELDALLLRASIESRGKYLELTDGVARMLETAEETGPPSSPAPASSAPVTPSATWTDEEQRRLRFQRRHAFNAAECARDAEYGVSRPTADLHLRQLMGRALAASGWDIDAAAAMLAGDDADGRTKVRGRIETFLLNLRRRLDEEGAGALKHALAREWRSVASAAVRLIEALEEGRIRGGWRSDR